MIFVTVGTQDKPFARLLQYLEECDIKEKVVIQAGFTEFKSDKYEVLSYIDKKEFDQYMDEADIVITHGGVGTIMAALSKKKKVIACARLKKYGEHTNDHQIQLIEPFKEKGYILELNEENSLKDLLEETKKFKVPDIELNNANFVKKLEDYIESI